MKTEFEYIEFVQIRDGHGQKKTQSWHCLNRKSHDILADIQWYTPWRQYCFFPEYGIVFNEGCLRDIQSFLHELNEEHKKEVAQRHGLHSN